MNTCKLNLLFQTAKLNNLDVRNKQKDYIARGLLSREKEKLTEKYYPSADVIASLERKLLNAELLSTL